MPEDIVKDKLIYAAGQRRGTLLNRLEIKQDIEMYHDRLVRHT